MTQTVVQLGLQTSKSDVAEHYDSQDSEFEVRSVNEADEVRADSVSWNSLGSAVVVEKFSRQSKRKKGQGLVIG